MQLKPEERRRFVADATRSWTLPGRYYYEPAIYARELRDIFYRSWQYVCHVSRLAQTGSYVVRDIGDQSVVVLRDDAGAIRAFHNVCQHRAHRLLEGEGQLRDRVTCPYHAWSYAFTGELNFARGSDQVVAFDEQRICLKAVRAEQICGFVFVNLDPDCETLHRVYPGLEQDILSLSPEAAKLSRAHVQHFDLNANWKNSVENYSECYHCPNRHPSLVDGALDISQYRIKVHDTWHRHVTTDVGEQQGYAMHDTDDHAYHEFGSWFVWPNMVFEVYPGGNLTVFHHVPAGPERTVQETQWYFPHETLTSEQRSVIDFVNVVREEDIPICESVQRGLHSMGYSQGRLIVDANRTYVSEHAVHGFQLRVARALGETV